MLLAVGVLLWAAAVGAGRPARPESLPKIVWTYQESADGNFVHELCVGRMRGVLEESRWVLEVITPANLFLYLHQHEQYKAMLKNHRKFLSFQDELGIAKLLILQEYGGLWLDPATLLLSPVDWLRALSDEPATDTHHSDAYELVLFKAHPPATTNYQYPQNYELGQVEQSILGASLDVMLALKESAILTQWVKELSRQLRTASIDPSEVAATIRELSRLTLARLLWSPDPANDKFRHYKVWEYTQPDHFPSQLQAHAESGYALADFYTKYPLGGKQRGHFMQLGHVAGELDEMLNPNISKLAYLGATQHFSFLCEWAASCAHYLDESSIVYALLIRGTRFEPATRGLLNTNGTITAKCAALYRAQLAVRVATVGKYAVGLLALYLLLKVQKVCVKLLYRKARVFLRPRIGLMINILKTVKNVIQYSRNDL